jgi:hypothetical protein
MPRILHVALNAIAVDPNVQPRVDGLDPRHVRELEQSPESWGPLAVVELGGRMHLVDGMHRYAAAQNLQLADIEVRVLDPPPEDDLRGLAFALNAVHGRPLSLTDRRAEAARFLRLHPERSDREAGRRCGLSQPTVARIRADLESGEEIERAERRVGADAKWYPAPARKPGDLPSASVSETLGAIGSRVFSGAERARQRRIVAYLRRLAVALEDSGDLLDDHVAAAEACRLVLGDEKAAELATRIGPIALSLAQIAEALS